MNVVVREWIDKAEGDLTTAIRENRARRNPNYDAVCFHSQQCIEKDMKAILQMHNVNFHKTHDLNVLLNECLVYYPLWESYRNALKMLTQYATVFRYPGESATREQAKKAVTMAKQFHHEIHSILHKKFGDEVPDTIGEE